MENEDNYVKLASTLTSLTPQEAPTVYSIEFLKSTIEHFIKNELMPDLTVGAGSVPIYRKAIIRFLDWIIKQNG